MMRNTHSPGECSEGCTGVRCPGDDEQQDDDEGDLGHLPFTLHLVEPLCRVLAPLAVDLRYGSVKHRHAHNKSFFLPLICIRICHFRLKLLFELII